LMHSCATWIDQWGKTETSEARILELLSSVCVDKLSVYENKRLV